MDDKQIAALQASANTYLDGVKQAVRGDVQAMLVIFVTKEGNAIITSGLDISEARVANILRKAADRYEAMAAGSAN